MYTAMRHRTAISALILLMGWGGAARGQEAIDGFTEPLQKVDLAPLEPGVLRKVLVEDGARVEVGQVLATLDDEVLQISLKIAKQVLEARGKIDAAKAEYKIRSVRLTRLKSLQPQGFAHREEIERAEADLAVAEANLRALEEQRALDALEYEKTLATLARRVVRSPLKGVITKVHHQEGEYVAGVSPVVFTVVQLDPLKVVFAVPAQIARKLQSQTAVTLRFPDSSEEHSGRIELISPVIDPESGLVRVKVLVANPHERIPCGARCLLLPSGRVNASAAVGNE